MSDERTARQYGPTEGDAPLALVAALALYTMCTVAVWGWNSLAGPGLGLAAWSGALLVRRVPVKALVWLCPLWTALALGAALAALQSLPDRSPPTADLVRVALILGLGLVGSAGSRRQSVLVLLCTVVTAWVTLRASPGEQQAVFVPAAVLAILLFLYGSRTSRLATSVPRPLRQGLTVVRSQRIGLGLVAAAGHLVWFAVLWCGLTLVLRKGMPGQALSHPAPVSHALVQALAELFGVRDPSPTAGTGSDPATAVTGAVGAYGGSLSWLGRGELNLRQPPPSLDQDTGPLFTVETSMPVYWVVRLYDEFESDRWRTSSVLDQALRPASTPQEPAVVLRHRFAVSPLAPAPPVLPAPNLLVAALWTGGREGTSLPPLFHRAGGLLPAGGLPGRPWTYDCWSLPAAPGGGRPELSAGERRRCLEVFADLPYLRSFVYDTLPAGAADYERALALRDRLRSTMTATLAEVVLPQNLPTVEGFVGVARAGYCAHFAEAMTLAARLAGIPARLAVGFLPGVPSPDVPGVVEVHPVHAHAWAQAFVRGYGWLTFDAVPPAALPLDGDDARAIYGPEWFAGTPELNGDRVSASQTPVTGSGNPGAGTTGPGAEDPSRARTQGVASTGRFHLYWVVAATLVLGRVLRTPVRRLVRHRLAALRTRLLWYRLTRLPLSADPAETVAAAWRFVLAVLAGSTPAGLPARDVLGVVAWTRGHCPAVAEPVAVLGQAMNRALFSDTAPGATEVAHCREAALQIRRAWSRGLDRAGADVGAGRVPVRAGGKDRA